jgi:hypothetical protein
MNPSSLLLTGLQVVTKKAEGTAQASKDVHVVGKKNISACVCATHPLPLSSIHSAVFCCASQTGTSYEVLPIEEE